MTRRRFTLMPSVFGATVVLLLAACGSSTSPANSCGSAKADANVNATDSRVFSPQQTTITHGQTVCWQNNGSVPHTVTSNDGTSFNSDLPVGQIFLHTFAVAGSFAYHCNVHSGMTGTVTVN
jgi:plastocyanin